MSATVTTTVTDLPESRVRVEAEVAPQEVERRMQQTARKLGSQLKIPGFRKGKVPLPVVIRRLGREYVLDEALRAALGSWYVDAIDVSGIAPVGEPDINVGDLPDAGSPLAFSIEIGVRPLAKLGAYKGIEVERREPAADEEAIDAEIERLRDRLATLETVDRPAELGDQIVMDYLGRLDGEPFEGGEGRDQVLELGSGRLIPGFEEQLVGAGAGDERLVEVNFPEDYGAENLAGKPATFEVTVSEVKTKQLPELDDEFASDAAGFDTLAELREDITTRLNEYEQHTIEHEFERDVLDAVAAEATIEVPHQLVHARAHEMVEETIASLARQGISKEMYLQISGQDEEQMAHEAEEEAEKTLRREAVIAAVVEAEKIEPTEAHVLEALEPTAERSKTTTEKLLQELESSGRLGRLRAELANRQAAHWLVEHAKPVAPKGGDDEPAAKKNAAAKKPAADKTAAKKPASKKPAAKKPAKPVE
ncbi:MAG TPA: trigger factor [Solirubrobacteraceae bacterium]|jgi:trigger factor|nr:trigger factor [Solirubrobacteraceae bacterium]